jgi:antitoxin component of RelBE/YafQ-DinJ toxin-antitoxin module
MKEHPVMIRISDELKSKMTVEAEKLGLALTTYIRMTLMKTH